MWIKMKKKYRGGIGTFEAGQKYDLPKSMIIGLPKDDWEPTEAPPKKTQPSTNKG